MRPLNTEKAANDADALTHESATLMDSEGGKPHAGPNIFDAEALIGCLNKLVQQTTDSASIEKAEGLRPGTNGSGEVKP